MPTQAAVKACKGCKVLEVVDTPIGDLQNRMAPAHHRRCSPSTATTGPTRSASTTSTSTSRRRRCSRPASTRRRAIRARSPRVTARCRPSSASATASTRSPRSPSRCYLHGWQTIDEMNRAFAGEAPSGYVAPPHLFVSANIDKDGGDKNIFDPGNGYRDQYKKIWGVSRLSESRLANSRGGARCAPPRYPLTSETSMATSDIPKPAYAHNMRAIGHSDQGGRPDAVQVMVNKGHAYVEPPLLQRLQRHRRARPDEPEGGRLLSRARTTPGTCTARPTTTCCSSCTPRTCGRSPSSPTRRTTTRARPTSTPSPRPRASATGRPAWRSTTSRSPPSRSRSASCRSTAAASTASGTSAAAGPTPRR